MGVNGESVGVGGESMAVSGDSVGMGSVGVDSASEGMGGVGNALMVAGMWAWHGMSEVGSNGTCRGRKK